MPVKWTVQQANALFAKPFLELMFQAQSIHRQHFDPTKVQVSTLLSIKTGACPEDCKYCPQSARYKTGLESERLMEVEAVLTAAKKAKAAGSGRFCMGAAWKNPQDRDMPYLEKMVAGVKALGLETCMTLGTLSVSQAERLAAAGLDFYNHNLDTSPEFYGNIITTRSYQERLDTLDKVRAAGMSVCSGGIVGLGESVTDRASLLVQLANMDKPPESVPVNMLVKVKGTPLADNEDVDPFDFIRTIAVARIMMPTSWVRLSAGREQMNEQTQAMCFMAGANSIFYGCKLLTTTNPEEDRDVALFRKLGITPAHSHTEFGDTEQAYQLHQVLEATIHRSITMRHANELGQRFQNELADLADKQQFRRRQAVTPLPNGELLVEGRHYSHFSSNDYLGLSHHLAVISAWQQGVARYGAGSGSSGHVTGYSPAHYSLERQLAEWLNFPRAILFSSGFAANQALIFAIAQKQDQIIIDRLMHASLQEAAHYSPATLKRFQHNDAAHLARLLQLSTEGAKLVVTEGIFSMDGDSAPLAAIANCCQGDDWLMVDDAHGIGVLGNEGRGSCQLAHIQPDILLITFGKAFGVQGAAILCQPDLAEYLTQKSRHLIYSTALPAAQAEAISVALKIIQQGDHARAKLQENIQQFRAETADLPWTLLNAENAIQPMVIGDNAQAVALANALRERGIWVNAIRPPTVPSGTARLRFTLSASHHPQQITTLTRALHELAN